VNRLLVERQGRSRRSRRRRIRTNPGGLGRRPRGVQEDAREVPDLPREASSPDRRFADPPFCFRSSGDLRIRPSPLGTLVQLLRRVEYICAPPRAAAGSGAVRSSCRPGCCRRRSPRSPRQPRVRRLRTLALADFASRR
jgi:hypothetical protein